MPLRIVREDITRIVCDAIVNPTNEALTPTGGVDAAIHRVAGEELLAATRKIGTLPVGRAAITDAFDLPARYIIHTVGPVWEGGGKGEAGLLASAYESALSLAAERGCEHVAVPLISSGDFGYPKDRVLREAVTVIATFLLTHEMLVDLVVYDEASYSVSTRLFDGVVSLLSKEEERQIAEAYCFSDEADDRYDTDDIGGFYEADDRYDTDDFGGFYEEDAPPRTRYEHRKRCANPDEEPPPPDRRKNYSMSASKLPPSASLSCERARPPMSRRELEELLAKRQANSFAKMLFRLIDARGMDDVTCYKRANVDKKTFSKIKCNKDYKPSKATVLSFAVALRLTVEETNRLLGTVGFTLSHSSRADTVIEYFLSTGDYKSIFDVNEVLWKLGESGLGV